MPVTDTSKQAYMETASDRLTQESALFDLYKKMFEYGGGIPEITLSLSDRSAADFMGWTPAHASARRNGLIKRLHGTEYRLTCTGKRKDPLTLKKVNMWQLKRLNHA